MLLKMYYESKFSKNVSNIKQTWTTINELPNKYNNKKYSRRIS